MHARHHVEGVISATRLLVVLVSHQLMVTPATHLACILGCMHTYLMGSATFSELGTDS
jgi:hypothetical protein